MNKRVTMSELAKQAQVDISTVSRALADSPLVKQKTKDHIMKLADELGYVVNASAQSLRRQSSNMLGIVIPIDAKSEQTISDPFYLEMVGAVSNAAARAGYDLVISLPQSESQIAERRLLQTGRADGLIVIGQAGRSDRLNEASDLRKNVVVWGGRFAHNRYTFVGSDNEKGGRLAAEHLFSVGRRRILFLGDVSLPEVQLRYDGFAAVHTKARKSHDKRLILPVNFGGRKAYKAVIDFAKSGVEFDAIFAASDVLAMAAIHALHSVKLSVPNDVSVVGYDNIGQSALSTPALTTINQNIAQGGELLVSLLLKKINGERVRSRLTNTELVVRQSSVPTR
ncbi:LacI family DNA-binding transcriptional regulator [Hyphomonas chukchiensis]|uniref:HTH lacI-type domain-containing protein n=1 Tax=Hyphomonas chukchiensis TaxID=1280947 RepID=A0A062ULY7_9PROT|nr:LacI family DNA-binding transcriptional regulator [Hyphomonas chukchiensis]KCZ59690.1 hypothetical protein HY30_13880 [Hyphomonas chukchiensis]